MANPIDMLLPLMIKVRLFDEVLLVDHDNGWLNKYSKTVWKKINMHLCKTIVHGNKNKSILTCLIVR
jgi:hypothetical protein